MKGDFSRDTFDPKNHFLRVLAQQGRVQLDADLNEQVSILLHYMQMLAADLIGPHGGPELAAGFEIIINHEEIDRLTTLSDEQRKDLQELLQKADPKVLIRAGRYYVDGVLCENESTIRFGDQPYWRADGRFPDLPAIVYLDVWEQHVTALDAPALREVALGGADTCTRSRIVWQVKLISIDGLPDPPSVDAVNQKWQELQPRLHPNNHGSLVATAKETSTPDKSPCAVSPDNGYRGLENRLYRVEIHHGGSAAEGASFKWSRDNGSVVGTWDQISSRHATERGFIGGQLVEIIDETDELRGEPGVLGTINDKDSTLTFERSDPKDPIPDFTKQLQVRRWDGLMQIKEANEGDKEKGWILLEDGLQIQFQPALAGLLPHMYRSGDYWLITARTATGDIEWPKSEGKPTAVPPHGVTHHYAPLAYLTKLGDDTRPTDLRNLFKNIMQ